MAKKSVRLGNALLNAGWVQAARCHSEAALFRVHKVGGTLMLFGIKKSHGETRDDFGALQRTSGTVSRDSWGCALFLRRRFLPFRGNSRGK